MANKHEILSSYRSLMGAGLRAIKYSSPARYALRDRLRAGFRDGSPKEYDGGKIARTIEFLEAAAKWKGLEHRVLKNWCHVWVVRHFVTRQPYDQSVRSPSGTHFCSLADLS